MITKVVAGQKVIDFTMLKKPLLKATDANLEQEIHDERAVVGFNISLFKTTPYEQNDHIIDIKLKRRALIVAHVTKNKLVKDKNGHPMGVFKLEDSTMEIEAFAFSGVYQNISQTKCGQIVKGMIQWRSGTYIISEAWEVING